jgi:hypothetical protein
LEINLEQLKAELKSEILQELKINKTTKAQHPWDEVKIHILKNLEAEVNGTRVTWNPKLWQVYSTISNLIRYTLGISRIANLKPEDVGKAINCADQIFEILKQGAGNNAASN